MVEFAVIVVLLLIILFGILEFGFIFLQEHFVANAAREGVRIGVRANNYNAATFVAFTPLAPEACKTTTDRAKKVDCRVRDYLATLYPDRDAVIGIDRPNDTDTLIVTVEVDNFFPTLLLGLVPGFKAPVKITFTATGDYEDPDEE